MMEIPPDVWAGRLRERVPSWRGPPPIPRTRILAAVAILVMTAALAVYAVAQRQRGDRLAAENTRLHQVQRLLQDSIAAQQARLEGAVAGRPATGRPP